jgi:hypothetical protein
MNEELLGLYQRILHQMDEVLIEKRTFSHNSVAAASADSKLQMLFEILAPYGGTAYQIEDQQFKMQHFSGELIAFPYKKEGGNDTEGRAGNSPV